MKEYNASMDGDEFKPKTKAYKKRILQRIAELEKEIELLKDLIK